MNYENEVLAAIHLRRSVRSFLPEPLPEDTLTAILEAGRVAPYIVPNSRHFAVIHDRETIVKLNADAKTAAKFNGNATLKRLCENPDFDGTYGAAAIVVLSGNKSAVQYEAPCAASAQNMLIAAQSLGVASCWAYFPIYVFHGVAYMKWRDKLEIPTGYKPCASVLLGVGNTSLETGEDTRYKNPITYVKADKK